MDHTLGWRAVGWSGREYLWSLESSKLPLGVECRQCQHRALGRSRTYDSHTRLIECTGTPANCSWPVSAPSRMARCTCGLADPYVIPDGHHRDPLVFRPAEAANSSELADREPNPVRRRTGKQAPQGSC